MPSLLLVLFSLCCRAVCLAVIDVGNYVPALRDGLTNAIQRLLHVSLSLA